MTNNKDIREAILKAGHVRMATVTFSKKMYSNGTQSPLKSKSQAVVEIGIDDLMGLINQHTRAICEDVIGEDEAPAEIKHISYRDIPIGDIEKVKQDNLRADQRQRLQQLLGGRIYDDSE